MVKLIECLNCNKALSGQQKKYCCKRCKQRVLLTNARQVFREQTGLSLQSAKGLKKKLELIKDNCGGCSICGYNKNVSALEFHHKDPKNKSFVLDLRALSNRRSSVLKEEIDKCILICSNCHQEIHYPHLNI